MELTGIKGTIAALTGAAILIMGLCAGAETLAKNKLEALAASAQPPLIPDKPQVTLDPGHGGEDGGCISVNGTAEKSINLAIALNERDLLTVMGYRVTMTHEEDKAIYDQGTEGLGKKKQSDMRNRLALFNASEGIALSIHQNQFTDSRYSGAQMFYSRRNAQGELLARCLQGQIRALLQPDNDREIKPVDDELYLLDQTDTPAVMAECGFLSNPEEAAKLESGEYQKEMAFVLFTGVNEYFRLSGAPAPGES